MLKIKKFVCNLFQVNTFIIWEEATSEGLVIDPGFNDKFEEETFTKFVEINKIELKYIFNTHLHIDHIMGNYFVKSNFSPILIMPQKDLPLLEHSVEFAKENNLKFTPSPLPDELFDDREIFNFAGHELKLLFTPGHTPGEYSFFIESLNACFTGDVLFKDSVGRTDLFGGDFLTLKNSIVKNILPLNASTLIFPGHGPSERLEVIKLTNPFVLDF